MLAFVVFDGLWSFAQTGYVGSVRFMLPLLTYGGHHVRVRKTELRDKAKKLREQAMVSIEGTKNKRPPKKRNEDGRKMPAGVYPRPRMPFDELVGEKCREGGRPCSKAL